MASLTFFAVLLACLACVTPSVLPPAFRVPGAILRLRGGSSRGGRAPPAAGLGAQLSVDAQNRVYFSHLVPGRAAASSGAIQVGDFLKAVDGWRLPEMAGTDNVQQVNLVSLAERIVGEAGTTVTLEVARLLEAPHPPQKTSASATSSILQPETVFNVTLTRAVPPPSSSSSSPMPPLPAGAGVHVPTPSRTSTSSGTVGSGTSPTSPTRTSSAGAQGSPRGASFVPRRNEFSVEQLDMNLLSVAERREEGSGGGSPGKHGRSGSIGGAERVPGAEGRGRSSSAGGRGDGAGASAGNRLLAAAADGDTARIERLVREENVTVDARDVGWYQDSPLHFAALEGHVEAIRVLVALGADVNCANTEGRTPLHYAAAQGLRKARAALVSLGADETGRSNAGLTPEEEAATRAIKDPARRRDADEGEDVSDAHTLSSSSD